MGGPTHLIRKKKCQFSFRGPVQNTLRPYAYAVCPGGHWRHHPGGCDTQPAVASKRKLATFSSPLANSVPHTGFSRASACVVHYNEVQKCIYVMRAVHSCAQNLPTVPCSHVFLEAVASLRASFG